MKEDFYRNMLLGSRAYRTFKTDVENDRLGHAYLIVSADGEALKQLMTLFGMLIYCKDGGCGECSDCLRVMHNNHPDLKHINLMEKKIVMDDIAAVCEDIQVKPMLADRKVYMIYRADLMESKPQNKLLKTLEEPAGNTTIFLATAIEAAILATVRSRTRKIYLDLFTAEDIQKAILPYSKSPERAALAAACCDGLLTRALEIASSDGFDDLYREAVRLLRNTRSVGDVVLTLSDKVFSKKNMPEFLNVLSILFRDVMLIKTNPELVLSKNVHSDLLALAELYSPEAAANAIRATNGARDMLRLNIAPQSIAENLFFNILENTK